MKISDMLHKNYIVEDLKAAGKQEVLEELAGLFEAGNGHPEKRSVVDVLMEREKLGSTGIGNGIAIPHGKMTGIEKILIGFGRSRKGIDFNALDGRPVHLFFLLLAPEASSGLHLRILAKISRMLTDEDFRSELMKAATADDLFQTIHEMDERTF